MGALRLLVADGNEIVRKGLCAFAREQPGWEVAAEARDGREAVEFAKQIRPDVAIMDIGLRGLNGLDATRHIAKSGLPTKVLLLTLHDTEVLLPQALEAGARGYLAKSDTADDLVSAVEALHQGGTYFTARVPAKVLAGYVETLKNKRRARHKKNSRLTYRQREVVQLVANGHSTKQVAEVLEISTKTAETHRANIMRKIDCHTVSGLVLYAVRNHIIEA